MKITLAQLSQSFPAMQSLSAIPLPLKLSYPIKLIVRCMELEAKRIDECRSELRLKYGLGIGVDAKDVLDQEQLIKLNVEWSAFLNDTYCEVPGDPIPIGLLPDEVRISPGDLCSLSWLIL